MNVQGDVPKKTVCLADYCTKSDSNRQRLFPGICFFSPISVLPRACLAPRPFAEIEKMRLFLRRFPPSKKSGKIRFSPCAHARFAVRFGEKGTKGAPRSFRLRFSGVFARLSTGFRPSARNGTPNGNPPFSILRFLLPVRRQLQPFLAPCLV